MELNNTKRGDYTAFLLRPIDGHLPSEAFAIAVSGGLDSMALLHATLAIARERSIDVMVFHVHHDLQAQADDWPIFIEQFCQQHRLGFVMRRLDARTRKNAQSIEDWARRGRYQALSEMAYAHQIRCVWLAQHQDDQIETHLLQKNRGAGVRGLSAMPQQFTQHNIIWQRPWLHVPRAQIEAFVHTQHISHVHDPSNDDLRFARNLIRRDVRQMGLNERAEILDSIVAAQLQNQQDDAWASAILTPHLAPHRPEIGEVSRLRQLDLREYSAEQQSLLLRAWFVQMGWRMPSRASLADLCAQLSNPRADIKMCWRHVDVGLVVARHQSFWVAAQLLPAGEWFLSDELRAWVTQENLQLRARTGGERVRLNAKRPSMSLKDAYQAFSVAPMLRAQLPLIYRGDQLVYVVGVGAHL